MKRLIRLSIIFGLALLMQGCAIYPYGGAVSYSSYGGPYAGYNYGYQPYGYYGYSPSGHFGWGGSHYWRGGYGFRHGWGGYNGWRGGHGWGGHHGWGGGHGRR
ncbi:MAG: hypothetical protein PHY16_01830 [Methylobacter sp.]|nr:hypothetical protein [Methylobacter sp.]